VPARVCSVSPARAETGMALSRSSIEAAAGMTMRSGTTSPSTRAGVAASALILLTNCSWMLSDFSMLIWIADAVAGNRSSRKGVLAPVSKSLERGAGPAHLHLGFGQPAVDLLGYSCRVGPDEGLDLHLWPLSRAKRAPTNMHAGAKLCNATDPAKEARSVTMKALHESGCTASVGGLVE
jgi:hypothetical protein